MIYRQNMTLTLDLWEFFSKWGFGDGDDAHALKIAWGLQDQVIEVLNKYLPSGIRAVAEDLSTIHNPCRIFLEKDGQDIYPADRVTSDEELISEAAWPVPGIASACRKALEELQTQYVEEETVCLPVEQVRQTLQAALYALDPEQALLERGWWGEECRSEAIELLTSLLDTLPDQKAET